MDDINYCGSDKFEEDIITPMCRSFKFGKFHVGDFKTLGWNIEHREEEIIVIQSDYIIQKIKDPKIH